MFKKVLSVCIIISVLTIAAGCSCKKAEVTDLQKTIEGTAQKTTNEVKNSAIPGFEELYKDTAEIDIKFASDGEPGERLIKIKDGKIISDMLTMIGKSELITDESKIKDIGGAASRGKSLIFITQKGGKKEIEFLFKGSPLVAGYLTIDGKKYDPGFNFFRYIDDFNEYNNFTTNLDNKAVELFKKYNWTIDYKINTVKETLPSDLKHNAGEYPVKIYWAYNNELSKTIGLDYGKYLGKTVEVDIYRLREPMPEYMKPMMNARGIVLKYGNEIIGAFIDAGRHRCFACSLDGKRIEDITGKGWDSWVADYINYNNELEIKLSKMSPEDIIKQYFNAMDKHDDKTMYACMTRKHISDFLAMNMDNNNLFNKDFKDAYVDGDQNVKSVKFIKVREMKGIDNPVGVVEYEATIDFTFKKVITSDDGVQPRFLMLKKESEKSGWRIESIGTGP